MKDKSLFFVHCVVNHTVTKHCCWSMNLSIQAFAHTAVRSAAKHLLMHLIWRSMSSATMRFAHICVQSVGSHSHRAGSWSLTQTSMLDWGPIHARYVRSHSAIQPTSDHIRNYMSVVHAPILVHIVHCHSTTTLSLSITYACTQEKGLLNAASAPNHSVFELGYELMREVMPLQLAQNSQHPCVSEHIRM